MKKLLLSMVMMCFLLAGCVSPDKPEVIKDLKIMVPSGAPALSLIFDLEEDLKNDKVKVVEGSDLLSSELVKKDSEYDVIIAPINLGCQLLSKGKTDFKLAGVLTWGNLYVIENEAVTNNELAAFGEMAVPGKIFNLVKDSNETIQNAKVNYFNAVTDVQAQVLAGKCQYALMAEPAMSATVAKAKQNGITLKPIASLQEIYQKHTNSTEYGYPQAAVFVKNKTDASPFLERLAGSTNQDPELENIEKIVNNIGAEKLGVPNAAIASKTWANQNIGYQDASQAKDDIQSLLAQFNITFSDDMIIQ